MINIQTEHEETKYITLSNISTENLLLLKNVLRESEGATSYKSEKDIDAPVLKAFNLLLASGMLNSSAMQLANTTATNLSLAAEMFISSAMQLASTVVVRQFSSLVAAQTVDSSVILAKRNEEEFNTVISRVSHLPLEEDDLHPTEYALSTALAIIYEANVILKGVFARAAVAVDEDGSIIFYWKSPRRNLNLTIPAHASGTSHIYHREGNEYGGERNVSAATLARWLRWYMQA